MKNEQEFQHEDPREETHLSDQSHHINQENTINFLEDYLKLLATDQKPPLSVLAQELKLNDIQYNPLEDHNQYSIHLLHHSKNYRTLTIKVILGPFTTVLTIFNDTSPSFVHQLNCLYGCCGNVYLLEWGSQQKIAVKCIQMKESHSSIFLRTIKQYVINKIASALRVGPKIIKIQQFDLIFYENCIQFCMEKCFLSEEYTMTEQDHFILKKKLQILHQLKIVHCDIKPLNIVYSENFKSPVFLDFGFSKILSSGPGTQVQTKFVGSLECCCRQMVKLYISKQIGMVDLYYNDACCLDAALKSDPIRQTGNDLQEIVKYCDPTLPNFRLTKIFFSLYTDQIIIATDWLFTARPFEKSVKIMSFLQTLAPTENLRQFYFKFFEQQWSDSIQFSELVKLYNYSHRHQLQLDCNYSPEQSKAPSIFCRLIQHTFNNRLNLFQLDNDQINFSENCIGLSKFLNDQFSSLQEKYDFFLLHVGLLNQNYSLNSKQLSYCWHICDHFISKICETPIEMECGSAKLIVCFQFLINFCLMPPISNWKLKTFQRSINELMILKKLDPLSLQNYLIMLINLSCQMEVKLNFLVSFIRSLTYQIAVWGYAFINNNGQKCIDQQIQKVQCQYYRLVTNDPYQQKLIKLDKFLLKSLMQPIVTIDSITSIEKLISFLKEEDRRQRISILKFIRIVRYNNLQQFEECRLEIQKTLSVSQIPIVLKPEYFLLLNVYYMLKNMKKCKQMFQLFDENIMVKDILENHQNRFIYAQLIDQTAFQTSFAQKILSFEKPYIYLPLIFQKYFKIKNKRKLSELQKYHDIILAITKDQELKLYLQKTSEENPKYSDKIHVYQRLLQYYTGLQAQCQKAEAESIRQRYTLKFTLQNYWLKNQFDLIVETISKGIHCKFNYANPIENSPALLDCLIKAYLMLNQSQKSKALVRSIQFSYVNKIAFIEKWLETITFTLIFQEILEKYLWTEFRQFLLAIVDFLDVHPAKIYLNSFIRCLRYAFSQKIDITQIDNGMSTILFPRYQWKYPLLSFFHIEALSKMVSIHDYLNTKQLQAYLWRVSAFFPFLRLVELNWVLQQYYQIALKLNDKRSYKRYILLRCRKLINFIPQFKRNNYYLQHIKILQNSRIIQIILEKKMRLDDYIRQQRGIKLSNLTESNKFGDLCRSKLEKYHKYANNMSMNSILRRYTQLMRLKLEEGADD